MDQNSVIAASGWKYSLRRLDAGLKKPVLDPYKRSSKNQASHTTMRTRNARAAPKIPPFGASAELDSNRLAVIWVQSPERLKPEALGL